MPSWDRIRVQSPNAQKAIIGGVIATAVLTILMYGGQLFGVQVWNVPSIIGGAMSFNKHMTTDNALWVWGVVLYAVWGVFFLPLCYAYWVYSFLSGPTWFRGLVWGAFLWFIIQMLFMPLIGQGVFDTQGLGTGAEIISQAVIWLAYGAVFGAIAGPQEVWQQRPHEEQHA